MKNLDKKARKKIFGGISLVLVIILLAAMPLIAGTENQGGNKQSILSVSAARGALEKQLMFSGSFSSGETETVSVAEGIRITRLLVSAGDVVHAGDAIAAVDKVSVMSTINTLRDVMKSLESQMYTLKFSMRDGAVTLGSDGKIYVGGSAVNTSEYSTYAEFLSLSEKHREYEEDLAELFSMYSSGAISAPCDGIVSSIDSSVVTRVSDSAEQHTGIMLLSSDTLEASLVLLNQEDTEAPPEQDPAPSPSPSGSFVVAKVIAVSGDTAYLVYDPTPQTDAAAPVIDEEKMTSMESIKGSYNVGDILLISESEVTVYRPAEVSPDEGGDDPFGGISFDGGGGTSFGGGSSFGGTATGTQTENSFGADAVSVATVIPQSEISLVLTVDEHDISFLSVGTALDITVDALGSESFSGTVSRIGSSAENNGGSSKFTVDVEMDITDDMLPGMNVCASLASEKRSDCILIPVAAVQKDSDGYYVYTSYSGDKFSGRENVELGISDGENVEVLSGLSEGSRIYYAYYDTLEISNKAK